MNLSTTRNYSTALGLAAALLAGCSASGSPGAVAAGTLPRMSPAQMMPARASTQTGGSVFVTEADNNAVVIYPESGSGTQPIGTVTNGLATPVAAAVDGSGNLFVANVSTDTVVKFTPPYTGSPVATLSTGFDEPFGLTVGPDGTLFVASRSGVLVFPPNSSQPSMTLNVPSPVGMTTDAHGDLFVADATLNDVEEFAPGSGNPTRLHLTGIRTIGGIDRDGSGNLLVADQGIVEPSQNGAVDVFPPGSKAASHKYAFSKDTTAGVVLGSLGDRMFVSNFQTQGYNKLSVFDASYPGGTLLKVLPVLVRGASGIAVAPRARYS